MLNGLQPDALLELTSNALHFWVSQERTLAEYQAKAGLPLLPAGSRVLRGAEVYDVVQQLKAKGLIFDEARRKEFVPFASVQRRGESRRAPVWARAAH